MNITVIEIASLGDVRVGLAIKIPVLLYQETGYWVADFAEGQIGAIGDNPRQAIANLQKEISDCAIYFRDGNTDILNADQLHKQEVLRTYLEDAR